MNSVCFGELVEDFEKNRTNDETDEFTELVLPLDTTRSLAPSLVLYPLETIESAEFDCPLPSPFTNPSPRMP